MAERVKLAAAPRTVLGKKVQRLRRAGRLPANVYGKGVESRPIELDAREFARTIKANGLRHLFDLQIEGEGGTRPVILRGMTRAGGTGEPTHADFFQVDPSKPIQANVPIHVVGESPAARDLAGTLVQSLELVAIRCLPLEIPDSLEVDAGLITRFDVTITVADIKAPSDVEILVDLSTVVAMVNPPRLRLDAAAEGGEGD